jgi:hypothetical protein
MTTVAETATATFAAKAANAVQYGGAGAAVGAGVSGYFGLTPDQWVVIGVIGGLVTGLLGLVAATAVSIYFKRRQDKREQGEHDAQVPRGGHFRFPRAGQDRGVYLRMWLT